MMKLIKNSINIPSPINISYWWNFGSLLGLFLIIQIITGLFLSMHYCTHTQFAFISIIHIIQNVNYGWLIHNIHMNGASLFFMLMYFHISRGIYYHSFKLSYTWMIGTTIFFMSMGTAFLGYVLPWGQMSFWGATVITNLVSTIPFMGTNIVQWIWGGFSINNATLTRFFSIHFIIPFMIMMMVIIHLMFLHNTGSSNPLGTNSNLYKIPFNYYFIIKDTLSIIWMIMLMMIIILQYPYIMNDPDNFTPANPLSTPMHIQPEWYFLFAYAILRSIPNKLGGVIAMMMSIIILYLLPMMKHKMNSSLFYFINQMMFWLFINIFIILTWLGSQPIEYPFMKLSQMFSFLYFLYFIIIFISSNVWDNIMLN